MQTTTQAFPVLFCEINRRKQMIANILMFSILIIFVVGCRNEDTLQKEAKGIPTNAFWVCGVDGGTWIDCVTENNDKYECEIYNDNTGDLMAVGSYFLRKVTFEETKDLPTYKSIKNLTKVDIRYKMWDGDIIHIDYGFALVPNGEVNFPLGNNHGKKQLYNYGIPIGEEKLY